MRFHLICLSCFCALLLGCTDRQRRNPLDPRVEQPDNSFRSLEAIAGNAQVLLRWDFSHFEDIVGFRLYRRRGEADFALYLDEPLAPETRQFVDRRVENGQTYEYRLALLISGEGERVLKMGRQATPGPEMAWVADAFSGLVWKIAADGRSTRFSQGRFPGLADIGLNRRSGACWVSDGFFPGLFRIRGDDELERHPAALEVPGALSIDGEEGIGWVADHSRQGVFWFPLGGGSFADGDSLRLVEVDARFVEVSHLAARRGFCWIVDRAQGRVLLYGRNHSRRAQWRDLDRPGAIAAGIGLQAWLLVRGGDGLLRLDASGEALEVNLPFAGAVAVDADRKSGGCWVLGETELAAFSRGGILLHRWTDLSGGESVAIDELGERVWLGAQGALWKFGTNQEKLAQLTGFGRPFRVMVDPGL